MTDIGAMKSFKFIWPNIVLKVCLHYLNIFFIDTCEADNCEGGHHKATSLASFFEMKPRGGPCILIFPTRFRVGWKKIRNFVRLSNKKNF